MIGRVVIVSEVTIKGKIKNQILVSSVDRERKGVASSRSATENLQPRLVHTTYEETDAGLSLVRVSK